MYISQDYLEMEEAKVLATYVENIGWSSAKRPIIHELLKKQPPIDKEIIVYRGIGNKNMQNDFRSNWVSTSFAKNTATFFARNGGSVIKIHLMPGTRILDVNAYLDKYTLLNELSSTEAELLVETNGDFYKDREKTEKGIKKIGENMYETYLFPKITGGKRNSTCRKKPYPWSVKALARSPFRTRKGVHTRGFTARSSLKSMGIWPRSNGCYVLGDKYTEFFI